MVQLMRQELETRGPMRTAIIVTKNWHECKKEEKTACVSNTMTTCDFPAMKSK
jgi:hypothetical protein